MTVRLIRLRYRGTCGTCATELQVGTKAWWDAAARTATCRACAAVLPNDDKVDQIVPESRPPVPRASTTESTESVAPHHRPPDEAGASAWREYERRHQQREGALDAQWGRLAGVAKFFTDDPQSTKAWAKGADGERRLARFLSRELTEGFELLHDRRIPGSTANIDHLVVGPSGIWIIDTKNYEGQVETRDKGGWFNSDVRLYVGGRDRSKLVEGVHRQVKAARSVVATNEVPLNAALCFITAEWPLLARPFQYRGVWVTWGKRLVTKIREPGPLEPGDVERVAIRLRAAFPPATR